MPEVQEQKSKTGVLPVYSEDDKEKLALFGRNRAVDSFPLKAGFEAAIV